MWPLGPGLCPVWGLLVSALSAAEPQETSALKPRLSPQVRQRPGSHRRAEPLGHWRRCVRLGVALQSVQKWHFRFSDASWKP